MEDTDNAAMQAMLGFSAFGGNKRHKSNTGAVTSRPKSHATSSNNTPLGTRPTQSIDHAEDHQSDNLPQDHDSHVTSQCSKNDIRSDPQYWTQPQPEPQTPQQLHPHSYSQPHQHESSRQDDNEVGYTSPWTGQTLTRRQVREYARGKDEVTEDGNTVTVFFKKSFVDDPWAGVGVNGQNTPTTTTSNNGGGSVVEGLGSSI